MDFDSLRARFDNCEAKYLRRSVGNPLNECLAEILCVRPSDPIEYMGLWLYRYADIRNYFKKKKAFYEELLKTKIEQDNKRMILIQKHNEAIIDITEPLVRPPPQDDDAESAKQEAEHVEEEKSKTTIAIENVSGPESDISDNSSLSRVLQPKINRDVVAKKMQEMKMISDKPRQSKTVTRASAQFLSIGYDPPRKKSKARSTEVEDEEDEDEDDSEKENLVNTHYFEFEGRRKSIEIALAKWKVYGHQVFCQHPILGTISMQKRKSSSDQIKAIDTVPNFAAQSMYDHELYTDDNPSEDLSLPDSKLSMTSLLNIDEMDLKSTSDLVELGTFFD